MKHRLIASLELTFLLHARIYPSCMLLVLENVSPTPRLIFTALVAQDDSGVSA